MLLEFIHEHGLRRLLCLLKELIDIRNGLTILQTIIIEIRCRMLFNSLSLNGIVMEYKQLTIQRHIYIKLASPDSKFLSLLQSSN